MSLSPLLDQHLCWPPSADLNTSQVIIKIKAGRQEDHSIRYRVRLAAQLVDDAHRTGLLDDGQNRLLIINAGASALSAMMAARDRRIQVLMRSVGQVGTPLLDCNTRHVDPCMYFWPRGIHWEDTKVAKSSAEPLKWEAGSAASIAEDWQQQFADCSRGAGLEFCAQLGDTRLLELPCGTAADLIAALNAQTGVHYRVILITGIEEEDRSVPEAYTGPGYWENDAIKEWTNHDEDARGASALISGSGDGALQDFLRLVCGNRPAREIYEIIFGGITQTSDNDRELRLAADYLRRETLRKITAWRDLLVPGMPLGMRADDPIIQRRLQQRKELLEQRTPAEWLMAEVFAAGAAAMDAMIAASARVWKSPVPPLDPWSAYSSDYLYCTKCATDDLDEDLQKALRSKVHLTYEGFISTLVEINSVREKICERIEENNLISSAILSANGRRVILACRSESFGLCYPLNQALALLISWYMDTQAQMRVFFPKLALEKIVPKEGHVCRNETQACLWQRHGAVFLQPIEAEYEQQLRGVDYDSVVIRHGLKESFD